MAIVELDSETTGLDYDSRFKQWGKVIRSADDLDLSQSRGYALKGAWIKWGDAVALQHGEFLVVASETGSRNYHGYKYALLTTNEMGEVVRIDGKQDLEGYKRYKDAREASDFVSDKQVAKAKNSSLYAFALRMGWEFAGKPGLNINPERAKLESEAAKLRERLRQIEKELESIGYPSKSESVDGSLNGIRKKFGKES